MKKLLSGLIVFFLTVHAASATEIFSNGLGDLDQITSVGGLVEGTNSFVEGVEGTGIYLPEVSAVRFATGISIPDEGLIEFWVKPDFDIKDLPRFSTAGLFEAGDFPFTDTFGVWLYRSEYGPVIVFEIKDAEGNIRQAWSKVTSFSPVRWHQVVIAWKCNSETPNNNYGIVYVDNKKGKVEKKVCKAGIDLANKQLRLGTTGFYPGESKSIDFLMIYDNKKDLKTTKLHYKLMRE